MTTKQKGKPIINRFFSAIKNFVFKNNRNKKPNQHVKKIKSNHYASYSKEKQEQIQSFCDQLFESQDLITSGRLQLIGLDKVKKRLGKSWDGLQPIVYKTVEDAANKFLDPRDLLVRYKDDSFLIVFAKDKGAIAEAKVMLIVDEIRKSLFEHEEKELRNIDIKSAISEIKPNHFKKKKLSPKIIDESIDTIHNRSTEGENKEVTLPKAIEVETKPLEEKKEKNDDISYKSSYMPLWSVQKGMLTTYLYCPLYKGLPRETKKDIAKYDIEVLKDVISCLETLIKNEIHLIVLCPVNFETLSYGPNNEQYRISCQALKEEHSKMLSFMVTNFPTDIDKRKNDFEKKIEPFKKFSSSFCAEWTIRPKPEAFSSLKNMGFDTIIHKLNHHQDEAWNIKNMEDFVSIAQKFHTIKTVALGISSLSLTTSAVCSGFNFIGGSAVHDYVDFPDRMHRFENENLFSSLIKD